MNGFRLWHCIAVLSISLSSVTTSASDFQNWCARLLMNVPEPFAIFANRVLIETNSFMVARPLREPFFENPTHQQAAYQSQIKALGSYEGLLGGQFLDELMSLGSDDLWVDVGAGQARAIHDYYKDLSSPRKARAIAIGVRLPPGTDLAAISRIAEGRFEYISGKFVEDLDLDSLGRAKVVTDVLGALHYSRQMDKVLEKELRLLSIGGALYTTTLQLAEVIGAGALPGEGLGVWLRNIRGVRITTINTKRRWLPNAMRFERIAEEISVPELALFSYAKAPPRRVYIWK